MDCNPPASSVHGILQARILQWVAMPSSRGSSQPKDGTRVSYGSCIVGRFFTAKSLGNPTVFQFQPQKRHGFSPCPSLYPIMFPIPLACGTTCSKIFFLVNQKQTNLRSFPYDILLSERTGLR